MSETRGYSRENVLIAHRMGIRVERDGTPIGTRGRPVKGYVNINGYRTVTFNLGKRPNRITRAVYVCWLQAFQKYGENFFLAEATRHFNGNRQDDSWDNIVIGSDQDNSMDRPKEQRQRMAQAAADAARVFTEDQVLEMRRLKQGGMSLRLLCERFSLKSKSHMSQIVNCKIYKNVG